MGGGGQKYQTAPAQTSTQRTEPWEGLQPYLREALGMASTAAGQTPTTPYGGPLNAPVSEAQQQANAQRIALAQSSGIGDVGAGAIRLAGDTLSGQYLDPSRNPAFASGLAATVRPHVENLQQQVLPQLTSEAWNAGAYGGDRYNIEQGRRISETQRNIGDITSRAFADQYNRERAYQMAAPGLAQAGLGLSLAPSDILSAAGAEQRGWAQEPITEAMQRYQMALQAPWQAVQPYSNILQGLPGGNMGTQTTTGQPGIWQQQPNRGASALSGAMGGASMGMSVGGPWGAAAGGILGGLGGLFGG